MQSGVYKIECLGNGKIYIGSSEIIPERLQCHRRELEQGIHHNKNLQYDWNEYRPSDFVMRPVVVTSKADVLFYEQLIIDGYKKTGVPLYNVNQKVSNNRKFFDSKGSEYVAGAVFNRLTIVDISHQKGSKKYYLCRCSCGGQAVVSSSNLKTNAVISCGCAKKEAMEKRKTHGRTDTKEYGIWQHIKHRCYSPSNPAYKNYGGRGIRVCDKWLNSFEDFFNDMGECPEGLSLDRINNDGNYEPENCRWADRFTQAQNRRGMELVTLNGEQTSVHAALLSLGIKIGSVKYLKKKHGITSQEAIDMYAKKVNDGTIRKRTR